jgi:hypothetical protein
LLQVHLLSGGRYRGQVGARRRRSAAATADAIADLGLRPAVRAAARLVIAWEDTALHAALGRPAPGPAGCLVTVDAGPGGQVITHRPFDLAPAATAFLGVPGTILTWGPVRPAAQLPDPVARLLSAWRAGRNAAGHPVVGRV